MTSYAVGKRTSVKSKTHGVEVLSVSPHGLWLWVNDKEYLLAFCDFPWFVDAKIKQIFNVQILHGLHLHWPDLDIDLHLNSLTSPEQYPLLSKQKSKQ